MKLQLTNNLCFFDLETTGIQVTKDRIVQIGCVILHPDGTKETLSQLIHPQIPIPEETTAIHGITDDMVANAPSFEEFAPKLVTFIGDADLAGYNSNKFDIPILAEEFLRVGINFDFKARKFVDVQNIFHKMEQRTLAAAYQFYCGKEMEQAHDALYDTNATVDVFLAQLNRYDNLKGDVEFLSTFSRNNTQEFADLAGRLIYTENKEIAFSFGKHKGKTLAEVNEIEPGYYGWFISDITDFPTYTKAVLKKEMERLKNLNKSTQNEDLNLSEKLNALKNKFGKK